MKLVSFAHRQELDMDPRRGRLRQLPASVPYSPAVLLKAGLPRPSRGSAALGLVKVAHSIVGDGSGALRAPRLTRESPVSFFCCPALGGRFRAPVTLKTRHRARCFLARFSRRSPAIPQPDMVLHGMSIAVPLLSAPTEMLMPVAYRGSLSDPSSPPPLPSLSSHAPERPCRH